MCIEGGHITCILLVLGFSPQQKAHMHGASGDGEDGKKDEATLVDEHEDDVGG